MIELVDLFLENKDNRFSQHFQLLQRLKAKFSF